MPIKLLLPVAPTITSETQGSILGLILFVPRVYIDDLPQNLLKLSIGTCADDTVSTFLTPAQKSSSRFYKKDLNNVEKQLAKNRLVLDQNKTNWMLFATRQKLEHCSDHTQNNSIEKKLKKYQSFVTKGLNQITISLGTSMQN